MKRELTCIVCPIGCNISVEMDGENIIEIKGNTCPRGAEYAKSECTNPVRTVTSTVMSDCGEPIAVKTSVPVPKEKMFECMKLINSTVVKKPVSIGDVIIKNIAGLDSDIIATQNSL